ncbi:pyroglutamyl-peptidase [Arcanobacterium wilhelmae]|uniref:Pyrrolidone-carboxylate peptidase n=1 Tax=Arcanobacterium wilhelmae TaxID=1803177 RepID=A0ABT9NBE6_9ACTO|nr:pyroglutamyl-peptidase I [Arcanobacterium wilhelmae]MDP9801035.1 pyroglutamyl-peptidase [Arcanobacterium wilhelmae]WFN90393.1 pyroglutamyl-peptidase I [Arcanobacterium wilhelmae]
MKILITGFDPFDGEPINPAWEAVRRLPAEISGARIITAQVPTVFGEAIERTRELIAFHRPSAVVNVGQAGGRTAITVERVAINIDDARIPDNAGHSPIDQPVIPGGPAAYFSTLPVKAMVAVIRAAGLPAALSNTAGTFVCNHLMYGTLALAADVGAQLAPNAPDAGARLASTGAAGAAAQPAPTDVAPETAGIRAGFIHVPFLPEQVTDRPGTFSLPLADIVAGLTAAVEAIATTPTDLRRAEGAEF